MPIIKTIEWKDDKVIMIDQRKLPLQEVYNVYEDYKGVADAIKNMVIRGAPAIGVAAAMGVALGGLGIGVKTFEEFYRKIAKVCEIIDSTRPTASNLFWATERMKAVCLLHRDLPLDRLKQRLKEEALKIYQEDIEACERIGQNGKIFFKDRDRVLTHCNAGALATAGAGTALSVLYAAQQDDKTLHVYADETRPLLQGARLTAWELQKHGMNVTVITDNMAGYMMREGNIDKVIVGADRIAANGDTANKIGTFSVAVLAKYHNIPFYVAAPTSTIDLTKKSGREIPIEERNEHEVTHILQQQITPSLVNVRNPAFDVTPAELITAIITENGIAEPPFGRTLENLAPKNTKPRI